MAKRSSAIMVFGYGGGSRTCDATCHLAKKSSCGCVCGGRYHAVGSTELARSMFAADAQTGAFGHTVKIGAQAFLPRRRSVRLTIPLPAPN